MDKELEKLYWQAKRFDESEVYVSPEYDAIAQHQQQLYEKMTLLFGPAITPMLEEYTQAVGDEMDLESRHFFAQGYSMGQRSLSPDPDEQT